MQRQASLESLALNRAGRFACTNIFAGFILLALLLVAHPSGAAQSVDSYANLLDERFASEAEARKRSTSPSTSASQTKIIALDEAMRKQTRVLAQGSVKSAPPVIVNRDGVWVSIAVLLLAALGLRKFVERLDARVRQWSNSSQAAWHLEAEINADEKFLIQFLAEFRTGPTDGALSGEAAAVNAFLAKSAELIGNLRNLLKKIAAGAGDNNRQQQLLGDLRRELRGLKGETGLSPLLPAWQTAAALEGLTQQLFDHPKHINQSTLRTVAAGVDLLEQLCKPGIRANLLNNPPLRFLVVDDDIISRKALSLALKKSLNQPDLAEDGEKAHAMVIMQAYDVIFLDVQMPGMDGFELCTKIHETVPNATTPVVFVTSMSDFDARARSSLSGGSDLVGKPFLTCEIAVKALTLALQSRLQSAPQPVADLKQLNGAVATLSESLAQTTTGNSEVAELAATATSGSAAVTGVTEAFLARAAAQLGALRQQIQAIFQVTDENARQEMLADFYLRFHSLIPGDVSTKDHPALRMNTAIEGLLKKLLSDPKHCTSSTLFTVATGIDVLGELCVPGVKEDLVSNPPIRLLIADDDPVARRAIICALQTAFPKPEDAECGESALALAKDKPFDVIFLDVQMPRMDGFTASAKIREISHNRTTPIVFVTGHSDFKSRTQATLSGGNELIAKPFLTAEITVKALTFALRGRLQKAKTNGRVQPSQAELAGEAFEAKDSSRRADERREARRQARRYKQSGGFWHKPA